MKILLGISAGLFLFNAGISAQTFPGQDGDDPWNFRPNDPKYSEMWQVFSHVPMDQRAPLSAWDVAHGSGMSVDKAWQLHLGTPETLVALLDSGIRWQERDLLEQYYLNTRELPLPQGSQSYDANHDGKVSVSDYAQDARVVDANGNGVLDPGDLIAAFSDGTDADNNGFVDDIAGWDFLEGDNDPFDRTDFGHGTGEAKDSVASINNGIGGAGGCGRCSVMFLRLNDSFIVDANAFARAVVYAADQGAAVIQQALGAINSNEFVQAAVNYATAKDVIIIGSAADEHSYHHNFPSTLDPIIYTNAIRYDAREPRDSSTYVNFNNCSNFGARVDVATSGRSCSSEATGNLAGITALARSYARTLQVRVDPMQIAALIKSTTDDLVIPGDERKHEMLPGWDMMSGYGRVNAYKLLSAIKARQIPPSLRVITPSWFELYEESRRSINVSMRLRSADGAPVHVNAYIQRGINSFGAARLKVYEGFTTRSIRPEDDVTFAIDRGLLASVAMADHTPKAFQKAVTIVVTARGADGFTAEQRRTVFVDDDKSLMPHFPVQLAGSGEGGAVFADIDKSGRDSVIAADGGGQIHVFGLDGKERQGFPVRPVRSRYATPRLSVAAGAGVFAPLAVGDIDGDGYMDIVAASLEGDVSVTDRAGKQLPGFPVVIPDPDYRLVSKDQVLAHGVLAAPVIADVDHDGSAEIVVASLNGGVYVFEHDGALRAGFPQFPTVSGRLAKVVSSPAVYDLDRDGFDDLVFGTNHDGADAGYIFALSTNPAIGRSVLQGFPTRIPLIKDQILPTVGTGIPTAPVIADVDGDGEVELVVHAFVGKTYVLARDGRIKRSLSMAVGSNPQVNDDFMLSGFGHPGLARFGDQGLSIVGVGAGRRILTNLLLGGVRYDFQHMVGAWNPKDGLMRQTWPKPNDDMMLFVSPVAADLDGDGHDELLVGSGGYFLTAYSDVGVREDFSRFIAGWTTSAPSFGDIDGDGLLDVALTTREGNLFVWNYNVHVARPFTWPYYKGNLQRTGVYKE